MSGSAMIIDQSGNKIWKNSKGHYHRTDGPALELPNGTKAWFVDGKRHRTNGPAVEYANGHKYWFVDGKNLGFNSGGFWALWDTLSPEQKEDTTLLTYLPGDFNV